MFIRTFLKQLKELEAINFSANKFSFYLILSLKMKSTQNTRTRITPIYFPVVLLIGLNYHVGYFKQNDPLTCKAI